MYFQCAPVQSYKGVMKQLIAILLQLRCCGFVRLYSKCDGGHDGGIIVLALEPIIVKCIIDRALESNNINNINMILIVGTS